MNKKSDRWTVAEALRRKIKISEAQVEIIHRMGLTPDVWVSAYSIKASISSLYALERKGILESRGKGKPGSFSMPETIIEFRLKKLEAS